MKTAEYINIAVLCAATVLILATQALPPGYILLAGGLAQLLLSTGKEFRRNVGLVYGAVALLGIAPINTSTEMDHVIKLGVPMLLVVTVPFLVTRYVYKSNLISFPLRIKRKWTKREVFYYFLTIALAYLFLPIILKTGNSYLNWTIEPGIRSLVESFVGLNAVGAWDELFFISTVFVIFRRHLPLHVANLAQAVLFTSFLYNMGFQGWCPIFVYAFALSQGYMYNRTNSLFYVLAVHLSIDVVLHLALVNLHNPELADIFITN